MIDCAAMAAEVQSQAELQRMHFMKQLAACVRRVQWTYAIFWSKSSRYEGSLEWNDGYYNGDIKTRKTTEQTECKADHMGLQRSEQLRELYESLCTGDCNQQNRPHASLSPEDLTDAEWYYLVCMSFTFNFGQDLPGKVYELNEPIWLNNPQLAENTSFCRSLLAKSASIQTVVCFPFMDGVLELGTSEQVLEEPSFVHNITSSFWEFQAPGFSEHSASSSLLEGKEEDNVCLISDLEVHDNMMLENHALITENDSHVFKDIIGVPEDCANVRDDPLSVSFAHNILSPPTGEREKSYMFDYLEVDHHSQLGSLGIEEDGAHYVGTLSTILENLKQGTLAAGFPFQNGSDISSFKIWEEGSKTSKVFIKNSQRMLKNMLCDMNWMNEGQSGKPHEEDIPRNKAFKLEADDANSNHVLSERRRREKLNEKFLTLRSLVPSISKVDKASILSDTIEYLKELEKRVEELEFCSEERDPAMRERRKHPDIAERTSDNYGDNELISCQKPSTNKRKACEIEDSEVELHLLSSKNGIIDINVTMIDKEVLVELHCPCRDFLLVDIIEALSNLRLDAHSVRSSTVDSTTAIALRAKFISTNIASPGMIKRSLHRVIAKGQINLSLGSKELHEMRNVATSEERAER